MSRFTVLMSKGLMFLYYSLVVIVVILALEKYGKSKLEDLSVEPAYGVVQHPCAKEFFGEQLATQTRLQYDFFLSSARPKNGFFKLEDYSSAGLNISQGKRKTCTKPNFGMETQDFDSSFPLFVIGGSTVEGWNLSDCHTIPSHLAQITSSRVINLGVRGAMSSHYVEMLRRQEIPIGSDLIFIDGLNEGFYGVGGDRITDGGVLARIISKSNFARWLMMPKSNLETKNGYCKPEIHPDHKVSHSLELADIEFVSQRYVNNVRSLRKYCFSRGVSCTFILQPSPVFQYNKLQFFYDTAGGFSNLQTDYSLFVERVIEIDPSIVDMTDIFLEEEKCYLDKVHYTSKCAKIFAEKIALEIEKTDE